MANPIDRFHSINVPSEWGLGISKAAFYKSSFHSINVPSEWGPNITYKPGDLVHVSIQLMSPASGDATPDREYKYGTIWEFPFN